MIGASTARLDSDGSHKGRKTATKSASTVLDLEKVSTVLNLNVVVLLGNDRRIVDNKGLQVL